MNDMFEMPIYNIIDDELTSIMDVENKIMKIYANNDEIYDKLTQEFEESESVVEISIKIIWDLQEMDFMSGKYNDFCEILNCAMYGSHNIIITGITSLLFNNINNEEKVKIYYYDTSCEKLLINCTYEKYHIKRNTKMIELLAKEKYIDQFCYCAKSKKFFGTGSFYKIMYGLMTMEQNKIIKNSTYSDIFDVLQHVVKCDIRYYIAYVEKLENRNKLSNGLNIIETAIYYYHRTSNENLKNEYKYIIQVLKKYIYMRDYTYITKYLELENVLDIHNTSLSSNITSSNTSLTSSSSNIKTESKYDVVININKALLFDIMHTKINDDDTTKNDNSTKDNTIIIVKKMLSYMNYVNDVDMIIDCLMDNMYDNKNVLKSLLKHLSNYKNANKLVLFHELINLYNDNYNKDDILNIINNDNSLLYTLLKNRKYVTFIYLLKNKIIGIDDKDKTIKNYGYVELMGSLMASSKNMDIGNDVVNIDNLTKIIENHYQVNNVMINSKDKNGNNLLQYMSIHNMYYVHMLVKYILKKHNNNAFDFMENKNKDEDTFMHLLIKNDCEMNVLFGEIKKIMNPIKKINNLAFCYLMNGKNQNIFMVLANKKYEDILYYMMQETDYYNLPTEPTDSYGNTLYHYICKNDIMFGSRIKNTKNIYGHIPLDYTHKKYMWIDE